MSKGHQRSAGITQAVQSSATGFWFFCYYYFFFLIWPLHSVQQLSKTGRNKMAVYFKNHHLCLKCDFCAHSESHISSMSTLQMITFPFYTALSLKPQKSSKCHFDRGRILSQHMTWPFLGFFNSYYLFLQLMLVHFLVQTSRLTKD